MLRITNLTLRRGLKVLLEQASLTVFPGHKVGLVGSNGCGKSSLFSLIRHELTSDTGSFDMPPRWIIAHVAQETPAVARVALDFVQDGDQELRGIEAELAAAEIDPATPGEHVAELHERYTLIGGHAARARAAALLHGLGFDTEMQKRAVAEFSGGWRMRLNLAQALMCRSDLLLLDEPTNHLDLDAVLWLEDWLQKYPGTMLLITHDRDFLDATVDAIVHFDDRKLKVYPGNYAQFEIQRAEQLALQQATYAKQQKKIVHLQSFVDRFRAKATKAKQAQSRLKMLEKMEVVAKAHVDTPFSFTFPPPERAPRQLFRLEDVTIGYGDRPVLQHLEWSLLPGERIGLLGPNGAGKSTLLNALMGVLPSRGQIEYDGRPVGLLSLEERVMLGMALVPETRALFATMSVEDNLLLGAYRQVRLGHKDSAKSLNEVFMLFPRLRERRAQLAGTLSGGERQMLAVGRALMGKPALLMLDEPSLGLAPLVVRDIFATITALRATGVTILLVEQNARAALEVADYGYVLEMGEIALQGPAEDLAKDPRVIETYLGATRKKTGA